MVEFLIIVSLTSGGIALISFGKAAQATVILHKSKP